MQAPDLHRKEKVASITHPHLRRLLADAEANAARAGALSRLSEQQLTWQPDPKVWSIAACIEHLVTTDRLYLPRIAEAIERAAPQPPGEAAPFRPTLFGRLFYQFIRPDARWKIKTFRVFKPAAPQGDPSALKGFVAQQEELYALIRRADGRDLNGGKFASPVTPLVRFTLGEGLWIVVKHQQRHLGQAERLRRQPGFPER